MKRALLMLILLVCLTAAAIAALPLLVSSESVRQQILAQTAAITGREMSFRDLPRITFSPFLGIEIDNVVFKDPNAGELDPPLLQMAKLRGQIRVFPALLGRVEVTRFQFVRPSFNLRVYIDGKASWAFSDGQAWSVLEDARKALAAAQIGEQPELGNMRAVSIGRFEIIDGTLYYENRSTGRHETLTNINGHMIWPDTLSPWSVSGDCIWRAEAFEFSADSTRPLFLLAGDTVPVAAEIKSGAFSFGFKGEGNLLSDLYLSGDGQLLAPSIRRLASLFGKALPPGALLADFSIKGALEATPAKLGFTEADITLDGNSGRGALQLTFDDAKQPRIGGTISAKSLDFSPYLAVPRDLAGDDQADAGTLKPFLETGLDLRVSAQSAKLDKLSVTDLAATLSVNNGAVLLEVGNATLLGGGLMAKIDIRNDGSKWQADGKAVANGTSDFLLPIGADKSHFSASGVADWDASFSSQGATLREVLQNRTGVIKASIVNGVFNGADFVQMYSLAQTQGDNLNLLKLEGRTAFSQINADISLNKNIALIRSLEIANSKVMTQISGQADIDQGGIAIRLVLTPGPAATAAVEAKSETRLFMGGSLKTPLLTRDPSQAQANPG